MILRSAKGAAWSCASRQLPSLQPSQGDPQPPNCLQLVFGMASVQLKGAVQHAAALLPVAGGAAARPFTAVTRARRRPAPAALHTACQAARDTSCSAAQATAEAPELQAAGDNAAAPATPPRPQSLQLQPLAESSAVAEHPRVTVDVVKRVKRKEARQRCVTGHQSIGWSCHHHCHQLEFAS